MKKIKYFLSFSLNPSHFENVIIQAMSLPMLLHSKKNKNDITKSKEIKNIKISLYHEIRTSNTLNN